MLFITSVCLIGLATYIVTSTIFLDEDKHRAEESLEDVDKSKIASQGLILRVSRPFYKRYLSPIVSSLKNSKKIAEKYKRTMASSGLSDILTPYDFYSFKLFLIVGFPIGFLILRYFLEADWSFGMIPFIAMFGFYYPNLWINGKIKARKKELIMNMPFAVDMLALSVEAGLDFIAAMHKVVNKAKPNALNDELRMVIKEIKVGSSRSDALRNMAWRADLIQISSFCATLIAADSVGASIGPILKSLSGEMRQKRSAEIEKEGAKSAIKLLIPIILFIVPATLVVIAAPMVLEFIADK